MDAGDIGSGPDFRERALASFNKQRVMHTIGARMVHVELGLTRIELPFRDELTQQHGFIHAGITTAIADSAGGYAALTIWPPGTSVLTVEFKINLVAPADGERLVATGRVIRPGRNLAVCQLEVEAVKGGRAKVCATGLQTMMRMDAMPDRDS